jgi:excisionase family DNA binding protein
MLKKFQKHAAAKRLLTTGDVAQYCETTVKQVNRWILGGKLEYFQNPGGQYRILKDKFREFLERNKMPIDDEFFGTRKKSILIADDDASLAKAYSFALQKHFKDVMIETAVDGYDALIKTGKLSPDLLILDIRMPKIDGLEVCRRLRAGSSADRGIKILAVTAHPSEYDRETVLASGANEYLKKPIPIPELLAQVEKML